MRDAGFHELRAEPREAEAGVEPLRSGLGVQHGALHSALPGAREECMQHGGAHALPAPGAQHRHSADVAVRQKPPRRDHETGFVEGEGVITRSVPLVELDFLRHALLLDEHREPHAAGLLARIGPAEDSDGIVT